jgi:hypothetical protein
MRSMWSRLPGAALAAVLRYSDAVDWEAVREGATGPAGRTESASECCGCLLPDSMTVFQPSRNAGPGSGEEARHVPASRPP